MKNFFRKFLRVDTTKFLLALVGLLLASSMLKASIEDAFAQNFPGWPDPIRVNTIKIRSGGTLTIKDTAGNSGPVFTDLGTVIATALDGQLDVSGDVGIAQGNKLYDLTTSSNFLKWTASGPELRTVTGKPWVFYANDVEQFRFDDGGVRVAAGFKVGGAVLPITGIVCKNVTVDVVNVPASNTVATLIESGVYATASPCFVGSLTITNYHLSVQCYVDASGDVYLRTGNFTTGSQDPASTQYRYCVFTY